MATQRVALVLVLQGPVRHVDTLVPLPMGLVRKVAGVAFGVVLGGGNASEDKDSLQHRERLPGLLAGIPSHEQLLGEQQRVDERFVSCEPLCGIEGVVAGQVDVLVVDDDAGTKVIRHAHPLRKNPTSPGGRWGVRPRVLHARGLLAQLWPLFGRGTPRTSIEELSTDGALPPIGKKGQK